MKSSKIIYQGDKLRIFLLLFQRQVKLGVKQCYDGIASYIGGAIAAQDKRNMIMLWWNPMQLMNFHLGLNRGLQLRKRRKMYMSPSLGDSIKCWNAVEWRLIVRTPTLCPVTQTLIYVLVGEIGWERNLGWRHVYILEIASYWLLRPEYKNGDSEPGRD